MRVEADETTLVVTDRPVLERAFGVFTAVAGGAVAGLCLWLYRPGGDWVDLTLVLLAPFLLIFAVRGMWRVLTLPTMVCSVDRRRRVVDLVWRAPLARRQARWHFDDIADFDADSRPGDDSWRARLLLHDGQRIALSPRPHSDQESIERFVSAARRLMTAV